MANGIYKNVVDSLITNGIHEDFAQMFVKKGLKETGFSEDTIDEKNMGIILQQYVYNSIQMFVDEKKAKMIIHKITLSL